MPVAVGAMRPPHPVSRDGNIAGNVPPVWGELYERLEQLQRQTDALQERVVGMARTVTWLHELHERAEERACAQESQLNERLQVVETRAESLGSRAPHAGRATRVAVDGEVSENKLERGVQEVNVCLRNEIELGVQELNEQMGERLRELRSWQEDLEADVQRSADEALQTCRRLADDSLAASEATQSKLGDLQNWATARFSQLEDDLARLQRDFLSASDVAERLAKAAPLQRSSTNIAEVGEVIDASARRTADELGGQLLQLGDALRRVVAAQHDLQQQLLPQRLQGARSGAMVAPPAGSPPPAPRGRRLPSPAGAGALEAFTGEDDAPLRGSANGRRSVTIAEIYEELRRLEEASPRHGASHSGVTSVARQVRPHSCAGQRPGSGRLSPRRRSRLPEQRRCNCRCR